MKFISCLQSLADMRHCADVIGSVVTTLPPDDKAWLRVHV